MFLSGNTPIIIFLLQDLQEYMDNSKNGVILFSMGSNLKSADLPTSIKDAILETFSKLKQNVLWKFEAEFPNLPKNVRIMKWLPQSDILGKCLYIIDARFK